MNRWLVAVKLQALPKVLLPVLVGLSLGYQPGSDLSWAILVLALCLAVFMQWTIVLLNDYADYQADLYHANTYPELFDRRALVEGMLDPQHVARAGLLTGLGTLLSAGGLWYMGRPYVLLLAAVGLLLLWVYSFAPLRLNYRGGGELLEAAGLGGVMPLIGYATLRAEWDYEELLLLVPIFLYGLIGALVSGLKHEPADRDNDKKTLTVWVGSGRVRRIVWGMQITSRVWCGLLFLSGSYGLSAMFLAALAPALPMYVTRRYDGRADYRDIPSLSAYKKSLQQAAYLTYAGLLIDFVLMG
ncbi:MAG: prenyltransferase [Candidatus Latescibacterota bacterium]|nr:prenyltransferase [Candidatus Latescibacterota bacterium]MEE2728049.1 prenyltransferase [Candidatus Latescibacterota bacterium]